MAPLDADPDSNEKPSDHNMVVMTPVSMTDNKSARTKKSFTFRPFTEEKLQKMQDWITKEEWLDVSLELSAHKKMEILQRRLLQKYYEFFPEKTTTITSDDQPFFTSKLGKLRRRKCKEFHKHRKSEKWKIMNEEYTLELTKAKKNYYTKKIRKLCKSKPAHWYRELKKTYQF